MMDSKRRVKPHPVLAAFEPEWQYHSNTSIPVRERTLPGGYGHARLCLTAFAKQPSASSKKRIHPYAAPVKDLARFSRLADIFGDV